MNTTLTLTVAFAVALFIAVPCAIAAPAAPAAANASTPNRTPRQPPVIYGHGARQPSLPTIGSPPRRPYFDFPAYVCRNRFGGRCPQ